MVRRKFPPRTAGARMISNIPRAYLGEGVGEVRRRLLRKCRNLETIDYIYVVDKENVLQGVISIKEFLSITTDVKIEEVMKKEVVVVHPLTHQERVVYLALSHGIKAVPVVDRDRHLLGIVPYDTILQIFNQEVREDIFKFGGIFHRVEKEFLTIRSPARMMVRARLPSLIIGLIGGTLAASIISGFEAVLSRYLILAAFLPAVVYLSDAVGTQSETLTVRAMALDPTVSMGQYFKREIKIASSLGIACSMLILLTAWIGWKNFLAAIVICISLFIAILAAACSATFLPFLLKKLNFDPASSAGPFATILSDVVTISIYFVVASLLLSAA